MDDKILILVISAPKLHSSRGSSGRRKLDPNVSVRRVFFRWRGARWAMKRLPPRSPAFLVWVLRTVCRCLRRNRRRIYLGSCLVHFLFKTAESELGVKKIASFILPRCGLLAASKKLRRNQQLRHRLIGVAPQAENGSDSSKRPKFSSWVPLVSKCLANLLLQAT